MPKKDAVVVNEIKEESKYLLSTLRKDSRRLFNISNAAFDGATASLDANSSYTIKEIKKIIDNWLKKPIA